MSEPRKLLLASDIHGYHLTLQALLAKARARLGDFDLYLLGDLIDRGPRSMELVRWAMQHNVPTCVGNHEDMAVDYHLNQLAGKPSSYGEAIWLMNGGTKCLQSATGRPFDLDSRLPDDVIQWMAALPLSITPPGYPDLLLSHTGHTKGRRVFMEDEPAFWRRDTYFPEDGLYRVIGHTSNSVPIITDTYANIDTGCAYGGVLSGLVWPTREIITQANIDS